MTQSIQYFPLLDGRVVIITGASRVIGTATAKAFVAAFAAQTT